MTSGAKGGKNVTAPGARVSPLRTNRRALILLPIFLLILVAFSVRLMWPRTDGPTIHTFTGPTMGTTYTVKLVAGVTLEPAAAEAVETTIAQRLEAVNAIMSNWRDDSEITRFNRQHTTETVQVTPHLHRVFEVARNTSRSTGGAFDITIKPVVDAWGFGTGTGERAPAGPDSAALAGLMEHVGFEKIRLGVNRLTKTDSLVVADLSAVAKGFGVDFLAFGMNELGYRDYLVEIGGELRASGVRDDGKPWRVAVERPVPEGRTVHTVIGLDNASMATSGDYRNYYEEDGRWLSHVIDARTGRPIDHALASVSVLARDCTTADAWATALLVLGPEAGFELAQKQRLSAFFLVREPGTRPGDRDGAFRELATDHWKGRVSSAEEKAQAVDSLAALE